MTLGTIIIILLILLAIGADTGLALLPLPGEPTPPASSESCS
jgi:hypothetical protein